MALNDAEVAPEATVTDAGMLSDALSLERETAAPPAGAGWVRVTVQEDVPLEFNVAGLQEKLFNEIA